MGTGRSGTTLLRLVLNAHRRIYITHEASFYLVRSGLAQHPSAEEFLERYFRSPSFAFLGIDKQVVVSELGKLPDNDSISSAYVAIMKTKAKVFHKARFGDKTPLHAGRIKQIFRDFPGAKVIHVVRDPRATVASLMRMPWAASSVGLNSIFCRMTLNAIKPFRDRIHEVRLEDLLQSPRATLRDILEFIGEPWDESVMEHHLHTPDGDVPPFPWFRKAHGPLKKPEGAPSWLRELSPAWIRNIELVHSATMKRYGYARCHLEKEPTFLQRQAARIADLPQVLQSLAHRRRLLRVTRGKQIVDPRQVLALLLQFNPQAWQLYPGFVMPKIHPQSYQISHTIESDFTDRT